MLKTLTSLLVCAGVLAGAGWLAYQGYQTVGDIMVEYSGLDRSVGLIIGLAAVVVLLHGWLISSAIRRLARERDGSSASARAAIYRKVLAYYAYLQDDDKQLDGEPAAEGFSRAEFVLLGANRVLQTETALRVLLEDPGRRQDLLDAFERMLEAMRADLGFGARLPRFPKVAGSTASNTPNRPVPGV